MFESCIGVVSFEDIGNEFGTLCENRPPYMLPFAGRYRLADFTFSNMINHGVRTIAVFTGQKVRSTLEHLGDGKPWDLNRRMGGLSIFPPLIDEEKNRTEDLYQYYVTKDFFINSKAEYVLIVNPNIVAKVDLTKAFNYFIDTKADITLMYKKQDNCNDNYINTDKLIVDDNGKVINIGVNLESESEFNLFMKMGFMKKEVFLEIVKAGMETGEDLCFKQAMINNKDKYSINSFEFKDHMEYIRGTKSYYNANMNLLNNEIFKELFYKGGTILTRSEDEASAFYAANSKVKNSVIANGCIIEGNVENSILFRGVKIGKNAVVKNSIIMEKTVIEEGAILKNTVVDRKVNVGKGVSIAGTKNNPYIVEKNSKI